MNLIRALTALPVLALPVAMPIPWNWKGVALGIAIWAILSDLNFVMHQHVHCRLTTSKSVNKVIDMLLGCVTGMSASNWRQHHIVRHHMHDESWSRPFKWELEKATFARAASYSLRYGCVMLVLPVQEAFWKGLVKRERHPLDFVAALGEHAFICGLMIVLVCLQPWFYGPYYLLVYFFTAMADYENHVGCDETEHGFSKNCTNALYNRVRDNFGYHTAHHYFPDAHWTRLPELHDSIATKIPADRISNRPWTGFLTVPIVIFGWCYLTSKLRVRQRKIR